jgi:hypothetical protein
MRHIKIIMIGLPAGLLLAACGAPASEQATGAGTTQVMTVYKSPTCGCCTDWVSYVEEHGYTVTVEDVPNLAPIKAEHNVPTSMQSCHTAILDGYVIEGHVPVADIERLLAERPDVVGIAVPGMPLGSPGMEVDGVDPQPFDVVTFDASGTTEVFSRYHQ